MLKNYPYLKDKKFLKKIDETLIATQYVRMTLLNWDDIPLENIEGRITGGTISVNGDSNIRRTCNLNSFVEDDEYDYSSLNKIFSLNKKIIIEIGIENNTEEYLDYPIIWFLQGHYIIMGLSLSHGLGGTTISLNLKDKMVLLNGECGGTLPASVTFHEYDDIDSKTGEIITERTLIYQIIYEAVNHFGEIPISKILINDIPLQIRQVMKWKGDKPLYQYITSKDDKLSYEYLLTPKAKQEPTKIFQTEDDVGYIYSDFYFPEELIGEAGSTVCDILEKIKGTLGNYEYFFDVWGNFVFQERKNYLNTRQSTIQLSGLKLQDYTVAMKSGLNAYDFNNSSLIISINNNPKYENIKNDFIVWGKRKTVDGAEFPIRYHLAIDDKPVLRNGIIEVKIKQDDFGTKKIITKTPEDTTKITTAFITVQDWRTELYLRGLESISTATPYSLELDNEWLQMYDIEAGSFKEEYINRPYELNYYLDFIEADSRIGQFKISNIGRRTKVLVDDSINCLFEPEIPNVIFIDQTSQYATQQREDCIAKGENWTQVDAEVYSHLAIGGTMNSAFVAIQDLLYQYTNYNESISITMLPIFHLEPNTRISVTDKQSGVNGDYVINSFNIPLDVNGTMQISAVKALEKI